MGRIGNSPRRALAANLRLRRKALGLSQERLAELAGLHCVFISMVERGVTNISIDSLGRLAAVLGCEVHELLLRDPGELIR